MITCSGKRSHPKRPLRTEGSDRACYACIWKVACLGFPENSPLHLLPPYLSFPSPPASTPFRPALMVPSCVVLSAR